MLGLKIGNEYLDLLASSSISVTMNNPIFDRDKISRTFSYPFKLPTTPKNKSILRHQDRLDVAQQQPRYSASLYINNTLFEVGQLIIMNTTEDYFKCNFKNLSFTLFDDLDRISIRDLTLPDTNFDFQYRPEYVLTALRTANFDVAFQVNDDVFIFESGDEANMLAAINAIYPNSAAEFEATANTYGFFFLTQGINPQPTITLRPAGTSPVDTNYFSIGQSNDAALDTLNSDWQDHLADIIQTPDTHVFPVIHSPEFFTENDNPDFSGYINYYSINDEYSVNETEVSDRARSAHSIVPYVFVKTVLEAIVESGHVANLTSELISDTELATLIIHNNTALDNFLHRKDLVTDEEQDQWRNVWATAYDLNQNLPDVSIANFLRKLSTTFCNYFSYRDGNLTINSCVTPIRTTPIDWTNKAEQAYTQTFNENKGYKLDYNRQGDDRNIATQLAALEEGDGELNFLSEWFSFYQLNNTDSVEPTRGLWTLPRCDEAGTSAEYNIANDPSLRLLFYRGLQPDPFDNNYPFASSQNINAKGEVIGNYTLNWDGEAGLFENFWKEYVEMLSTGKEVQKVLRLTVQDLIELKDFENPTRYLYHTRGNIRAVIKQVQFKVSSSGIAPARVTFVTI